MFNKIFLSYLNRDSLQGYLILAQSMILISIFQIIILI